MPERPDDAPHHLPALRPAPRDRVPRRRRGPSRSPADPSALGDEAWAEFLFVRTNPKGVHAERWNHAHGCQRWFNALRDTVSDRILATYKAGEPRPALAPKENA